MLEFAKSLKLIRKKHKISIEQLSKTANVSKSMIYKIENNEAEPSLEIALRLARTLNVNINTMLDESEKTCNYVFPYNEQHEWQDPHTELIWRSLLPGSHRTEWVRVILPAHSNTGMIPAMPHKTIYIYVLSGSVTMEFADDDPIALLTEDICIVPTTKLRTLINKSSKPCEVFGLTIDQANSICE
jgi:transcriptional regulator with XRE-family HTH domain